MAGVELKLDTKASFSSNSPCGNYNLHCVRNKGPHTAKLHGAARATNYTQRWVIKFQQDEVQKIPAEHNPFLCTSVVIWGCFLCTGDKILLFERFQEGESTADASGMGEGGGFNTKKRFTWPEGGMRAWTLAQVYIPLFDLQLKSSLLCNAPLTARKGILWNFDSLYRLFY